MGIPNDVLWLIAIVLAAILRGRRERRDRLFNRRRFLIPWKPRRPRVGDDDVG